MDLPLNGGPRIKKQQTLDAIDHKRRIAEPKRVPLRTTVPLQKRKVIKSSFKGICWLLLFAALSSGALLLAQYGKGVQISTGTILLGSLVFILALAWEIAYPFLYYVTYFYDVDRDNVIIRKGILAKREITLPFARITDVYVEQDILDVFLGLYNVYISSPTVESGKFAHIGGVDKEGARKLREIILKGINDIQYYRE